MTLAEIAEKWAKQNGKKVPKRETKEWDIMYKEWHAFAFATFNKRQKGK